MTIKYLFKYSALCCLFLFTARPGFGQDSGYAPSENVDIYYRTYGMGVPILIINGGPGMNSEGFIPLAKRLGEYGKAIIFDQRGTGLSKIPELNRSTITIKLMLDDLEALRKHLKIEEWIILGHSFGGMLASAYAASYPEHIQAMILSSSGGPDLQLLSHLDIREKLTQTERDSLDYWNQRMAAGDTSYHALLQRGMYLAPAYVYNREHIPVIAERLTQGNSRVNSLVWSDLQNTGFDYTEQLKSFTKPVLIIQGTEDILQTDIARKTHQLLPDSRLILFDEMAHYGWLDREEDYYSAIASFLEEVADSLVQLEG